MTANGLPVGVLVILAGVALVICAWLAMRFGRAIALGILALGILVVGVLGAGALLSQGAANYQTAKAATEAVAAVKAASIGQSITTVIIALGVGLGFGVMGIVTVGALGVGGYFALRYKLAERGQLAAGQRRQALPETVHPGQIVYVFDENADDDVDLAGVDLTKWGW